MGEVEAEVGELEAEVVVSLAPTSTTPSWVVLDAGLSTLLRTAIEAAEADTPPV